MLNVITSVLINKSGNRNQRRGWDHGSKKSVTWGHEPKKSGKSLELEKGGKKFSRVFRRNIASFSIMNVTNYHKINDLKQPNSIT